MTTPNPKQNPSFEQAAAFFDLLVGWRTVGVSDYNEAREPRSPEARAFLCARVPSMPLNMSVVARPEEMRDKQYGIIDAVRALCDAWEAGPT